MNKDKVYVLRNSDGMYFAGYNYTGNQLRKAMIYYGEKYAQHCADAINRGFLYGKHDFKLVEVEIVEASERRLLEDKIEEVIHKTILEHFDIAPDDSEEPMTDKDKLLLEVNKEICNNIKKLFQNKGE